MISVSKNLYEAFGNSRLLFTKFQRISTRLVNKKVYEILIRHFEV